MKVGGIAVAVGIFVFLGLIFALMVGCPHYNVWQQEMAGRAELSRAEQNKQVLVIEAEAMLEVERLNAQMEVERARGAAQAMEIIQEKLTHEYLIYRWIMELGQTQNTVIYVPTDGTLPILEAGRLR
ncbi:MAG: hypothetical protein FWC97_06395 [Treponema sp.]|nr:hypothetical protein [Treponema sp.]